jgi:hypothetical protein
MNARLLAPFAIAAALLAGCTHVTPVAQGEVLLKNRLLVRVDVPWNQFERTVSQEGGSATWTHEGLTVDALQFYVAVKDGELIAPTPGEPKGVKPLAFRASMATQDVVDLLQALWSRDGSAVTIERVAPQPFLGGEGFRIDYTRVRKVDEVRLQGVVWGAVRDGELHLIHYSAPRLAFFARYLPRAEALAASARLRS